MEAERWVSSACLDIKRPEAATTMAANRTVEYCRRSNGLLRRNKGELVPCWEAVCYFASLAMLYRLCFTGLASSWVWLGEQVAA